MVVEAIEADAREAGASKKNLLNQKARVEAMRAEARKEADAATVMAKPSDATMAALKMALGAGSCKLSTIEARDAEAMGAEARKEADAAMAMAKPSDAIMVEMRMPLGAGSRKLSTMKQKKKTLF